jgi:hypothetical protein
MWWVGNVNKTQQQAGFSDTCMPCSVVIVVVAVVVIVVVVVVVVVVVAAAVAAAAAAAAAAVAVVAVVVRCLFVGRERPLWGSSLMK